MMLGGNVPDSICNKNYATCEVNAHWASLFKF